MSTVQIELSNLMCPTCGIVFALPSGIYKRRGDDDEGIYCPNGHANVWPAEKPALLNGAQRADILAAHEAEQAEARAMDTTRAGKATDGTIIVREMPCIVRPDGRKQCPRCPKHYLHGWRLRAHIEDVHKIRFGMFVDPAEAAK